MLADSNKSLKYFTVVEKHCNNVISSYVVHQVICHILMNNRVIKQGEKESTINIRGKANVDES